MGAKVVGLGEIFIVLLKESHSISYLWCVHYLAISLLYIIVTIFTDNMMFRIIVCFFFFYAQAHGQAKFPPPFTQWRTSMSSCGELSSTHYYTCGDTIVGNEVFTSFFGGLAPFWGGLTFEPLGWFRKTENHVFYKPDWFSTEYLLYQFNLEVGDTCRVIRNYQHIGSSASTFKYPLFEVVFTDTVLIEDVWRKRWVLTSNDPEIKNEIWLEGIGSTRGLVDVTYCFDGQVATLSCMAQGFDVLYESDEGWICAILSNLNCQFAASTSGIFGENVAVFPNPFSDFLDILTPELPDMQVRLTNTMGQIFTPLHQKTSQGARIARDNLPSGWYQVALLSNGHVVYHSRVIAF